MIKSMTRFIMRGRIESKHFGNISFETFPFSPDIDGSFKVAFLPEHLTPHGGLIVGKVLVDHLLFFKVATVDKPFVPTMLFFSLDLRETTSVSSIYSGTVSEISYGNKNSTGLAQELLIGVLNGQQIRGEIYGTCYITVSQIPT